MKKKILIVDDEEDICDFGKRALERTGEYDVVATNYPKDVEQICLDEKPDLIVLDIVMPEMPGTEVIRVLKANPNTADIKIIVASGGGEMIYHKGSDEWQWEPMVVDPEDKPEDMVEDPSPTYTAERYGVEKFLKKPFTTAVLVQVVKEVLGGAAD